MALVLRGGSRILEASDEALTKKEIVEETGLPPRTVRYALDTLIDDGLVDERLCPGDARQRLYYLRSR